MDQETNYQHLLQQEKSVKLQMEELNREKETVVDELKNATAQKEALELQLTELRARDGTSKDENDGSTSPEIIPSNFSFGSSDIQVRWNSLLYAYTHVIPHIYHILL